MCLPIMYIKHHVRDRNAMLHAFRGYMYVHSIRYVISEQVPRIRVRAFGAKRA